MNKLFPLPVAPDLHHEMLEYFTQQVKHKKSTAFMQGQRKKPPLIKAIGGSGKGTKDLSDSGDTCFLCKLVSIVQGHLYPTV